MISSGPTDPLFEAVYEELRALAQSKLRAGLGGASLQATAVVHDVWLKLSENPANDQLDESHYFATAAQAMRWILVDRARARQSSKRDGGRREDFEVAMEVNALGGPDTVDVLMFDEALSRLAELDERKARVVELRYFSGLTMDEVAETLHVAKRTAESDWTFARTWLKRELRDR